MRSRSVRSFSARRCSSGRSGHASASAARSAGDCVDVFVSRDWYATDLSVIIGVPIGRARNLYNGRRPFTIEELHRFVRWRSWASELDGVGTTGPIAPPV